MLEGMPVIVEVMRIKIQIVGPGYPKCQASEKNVREACSQLGLDTEIEYLYNLKDCVRPKIFHEIFGPSVKRKEDLHETD